MADLGNFVGASGIGSALSRLLASNDDIVPGSSIGYELAKLIYVYHPLGARMAVTPINLAQSMPRDISIPGSPERLLKREYMRVWKHFNRNGADRVIRDIATLARVYGICSGVVGVRGTDPKEPLDVWHMTMENTFVSVFDPLNTAGSLVLNQNPNDPDFMKPTPIYVSGVAWHPSRTVVVMNEEPVYIQWSASAFGFSGRSVYQRALYPLKSYIQSMLTDDIITRKAALLVAKMEMPSSIINRITQSFYQGKRDNILSAQSGNVLQIGPQDEIESLDLRNVREAAEFARNNCIANCALSVPMPVQVLNMQTLALGFGEGSEDAKQIARYVENVRLWLDPIYEYFDDKIMHIAWSEEFYKSIQHEVPEYANVPYRTAFYKWKNAFVARWPNPLVEPDSEAVKREVQIADTAVGYMEIMAPLLDKKNQFRLMQWAAKVINDREAMMTDPLVLDEQTFMSEPVADPGVQEPETRMAYDIGRADSVSKVRRLQRRDDRLRVKSGSSQLQQTHSEKIP